MRWLSAKYCYGVPSGTQDVNMAGDDHNPVLDFDVQGHNIISIDFDKKSRL